MNIILTEDQLKNIEEKIKNVKFYSDDEIKGKEDDDQINIDLFGVYNMNEMDKFYNETPYSPTTKFYNDNESKWKRLTTHYPVIILKIPYTNIHDVKSRTNKTLTTTNELYAVLYNNGRQWYVFNAWNKTKNPQQQKIFDHYFIGKNLNDFVDNLIGLSFFPKFAHHDIVYDIITILKTIPKTSPDQNIITDHEIDAEFREPIRFTLRNGENPKPIIDKIINKYGRISKEIQRLLDDGPQVLKKPRPNPYL